MTDRIIKFNYGQLPNISFNYEVNTVVENYDSGPWSDSFERNTLCTVNV